MHTANRGASDNWDAGGPDYAEPVEQRLAQYAFVREERDREVRLLFRDVPATEIAGAFMSAGASLISISGERVRKAAGKSPPGDHLPAEPGKTGVEIQEQRRPCRRRKPPTPDPAGEALLRYFFSLRETVYTVSLASQTGVISSIAAVYPLATGAERELTSRLNVVFR